jgi:uncharacterized protein (DUF488 family)
MTIIYTIGHSDLAVSRFVALLRSYGVRTVVDVRSAPHSAHVPQFNKHDLERELSSSGFTYLYAGGRLGGKPSDQSFYTASGVVDYDRLGESPAFTEGLDWLAGVASGECPAVMCSEGDPFLCHREKLIGRKLRKMGLQVLHITGDGRVVTQEQGDLF